MTSLRLDRLLSNLAYGSRKEVALMVKAARITYNSVVVKRADESIPLADVHSGALLLDGEKLDPPAPFTIMLNKPPGYTCSHDEKGPLVFDLLPARWKLRKPAMACAGRLDKYSTGQVILTDDGALLHRIIHPKQHAAKHYAVTLMQDLRGDEAALFATGSFLMAGDPKPLKPAQWIQEGPKSGVMILHEGRYHQVRRMFATLGNEVHTLHRFQTGGLQLLDLEEGQYRMLVDTDIARIFAAQPASGF